MKKKLEILKEGDTQPIYTVICDNCGKIHDLDGRTYFTIRDPKDDRVTVICRLDRCLKHFFLQLGLVFIDWPKASVVARRRARGLEDEFKKDE